MLLDHRPQFKQGDVTVI